MEGWRRSRRSSRVEGGGVSEPYQHE